MLIRESSDLSSESADDFELEHEDLLDIEQHSRKIFLGDDITDKRLIKSYQAKRWRDDFKYNKGKSSALSESEYGKLDLSERFFNSNRDDKSLRETPNYGMTNFQKFSTKKF